MLYWVKKDTLKNLGFLLSIDAAIETEFFYQQS